MALKGVQSGAKRAEHNTFVVLTRVGRELTATLPELRVGKVG